MNISEVNAAVAAYIIKRSEQSLKFKFSPFLKEEIQDLMYTLQLDLIFLQESKQY
jgi:hypothetical protein